MLTQLATLASSKIITFINSLRNVMRISKAQTPSKRFLTVLQPLLRPFPSRRCLWCLHAIFHGEKRSMIDGVGCASKSSEIDPIGIIGTSWHLILMHFFLARKTPGIAAAARRVLKRTTKTRKPLQKTHI